MVGPEHEKTAAVRKLSRMFAVGASMSVPIFSIVTRKAYGLGAMAMAGGQACGANAFHVSWPSGERSPMASRFLSCFPLAHTTPSLPPFRLAQVSSAR